MAGEQWLLNPENRGLKFINALAELLELPMDTRKVTIEAEVNGLVVVTVERLPKGVTVMTLPAKAFEAMAGATVVVTDPPESR